MVVLAAFGLLCGASSTAVAGVLIAARRPGRVHDWLYGRS